MKREQSDEDKDDLKKASGKRVEEKIRQKRILREYVIFLVTENKRGGVILNLNRDLCDTL